MNSNNKRKSPHFPTSIFPLNPLSTTFLKIEILVSRMWIFYLVGEANRCSCLNMSVMLLALVFQISSNLPCEVLNKKHLPHNLFPSVSTSFQRGPSLMSAKLQKEGKNTPQIIWKIIFTVRWTTSKYSFFSLRCWCAFRDNWLKIGWMALTITTTSIIVKHLLLYVRNSETLM